MKFKIPKKYEWTLYKTQDYAKKDLYVFELFDDGEIQQRREADTSGKIAKKIKMLVKKL